MAFVTGAVLGGMILEGCKREPVMSAPVITGKGNAVVYPRRVRVFPKNLHGGPKP